MAMTLKAARVNAGLNQVDACKVLGISKTTLQNYEAYNTKPSMEMGQKIASAYGVTVDDIKWSKE